jgi:hypothetical protein
LGSDPAHGKQRTRGGGVAQPADGDHRLGQRARQLVLARVGGLCHAEVERVVRRELHVHRRAYRLLGPGRHCSPPHQSRFKAREERREERGERRDERGDRRGDRGERRGEREEKEEREERKEREERREDIGER